MDELIDRKKLSAVMTEVGLDMTRGAGTAPASSLYFQPVTNGHTETPSRLSRVLPRTLPGKNPCYVPWRQWVGKKTWPLAAGPAPTPHKQPHYCRDTTLPPPYFNTSVPPLVFGDLGAIIENSVPTSQLHNFSGKFTFERLTSCPYYNVKLS